MYSQETLYQLIFTEQWKEILDALYLQRKTIKGDTLLTHAGQVFENAFFSKVKDYTLTDRATCDLLDTLYVLHHGKFYLLTDANYKTLVIELAKRKSISEAINYARIFPEEPESKKVIQQYKDEKLATELSNPNVKLPVNWIEIFNRLFELINDKDDVATYFSGPRFINVVKEVKPYHPDYTQYIDQRNSEGKSTSRKIYYYDILIALNDNERTNVILRFLDLLQPFKAEKVKQVRILMGMESVSTKQDVSQIAADSQVSQNPKVFISYSWDDEDHQQWVLNLANRLRSHGIDIILDKYHLKAGKSITHFVENGIRVAERIIIIFTPNYKLKADKRDGGVGYEYSILNNTLYQNQTGNEKIIPVLRAGSNTESIPEFMQQYIHLDLRNDLTFDNSYKDLLREIYNEPSIVMPELGEKPQF